MTDQEKQLQVLTGKIHKDNVVSTVTLWDTHLFVLPTTSLVHFGFLCLRKFNGVLCFGSTFLTELYEEECKSEPPRNKQKFEEPGTPPSQLSQTVVQAEEDFDI